MDKKNYESSLESFEKYRNEITLRLGLYALFTLENTSADYKGNIDAVGIDYLGNTYEIQHKHRQGKTDFCFEIDKEANPTHPVCGTEYKYSLHIGKAQYLTYELEGKLYIFDYKTLNIVYSLFHELFEEHNVTEDNGYTHRVCYIKPKDLVEIYKGVQINITTGETTEELKKYIDKVNELEDSKADFDAGFYVSYYEKYYERKARESFEKK